jgi:hypothetical protein
MQEFSIRTPRHKFELFFELHNLPSALPYDAELSNASSHLHQLKEQVHNAKLEEFTEAKALRPHDDPTTVRRLSDAGYQVVRELKVQGWIPLNPVRSSSFTANH